MYVKHTLFTLIIVVVFFGTAELVLAVAGVRPMLLTEDPFVGFARNVPQFVEHTAPDGSVWMRTAPNKQAMFNPQEFPKVKAPGTYRIFCMGGSTTYGRPYFDELSFCGWLRAYLKAAAPSRNWEVINAGGVSYASYRVARLMGELKQYQPDLFIVYSGQNEFLEQRSYGGLINMPGWLLNLNATLSGTRVYTALAEAIDALRPDSLKQARARSQMSGEVDEILNHTVGPQSYHRDDLLKHQITTHYRLNLVRMVKIARSVDAGIVFVQPAINIRSMSPFKSEHRAGLDAAALAQWQAHYEQGKAQEAAGDAGAALAAYREALAIDDRYAELHYRIGQLRFRQGRYAEAEQALRRAVEEDVAPLRILASMQRDVAQVAAEEDVPLVDFPGILRAAYRERYGHTVFGKEYFVDHVHANKEGYRMLGLALFQELEHEGVVTPGTGWNTAARKAVEQKVLAGIDPRDEGGALLNLGKVLEWAGKFEEAYPVFQQSLNLLGPSELLYDRLARSAYALGKMDEAIHYLNESLKISPDTPGVHAKLATILGKMGRIKEAIEQCRAELILRPDNYYVYGGLAELLEKKGDDAAAIRNYKVSLQLKPDFEFALVKLSELLLRQGRYDEALAHSREALRVNPQQYRTHNTLGMILKHQGKYEQAIEHFMQALRLKPDNRTAMENLQQLQVNYDKGGKAASPVSLLSGKPPRNPVEPPLPENTGS